MGKRIYHEVESHYTDKLNIIREEIIGSIKSALKWLGGRVSPRHYHEWADLDRYTFFECDDDGYGVSLYLDEISTNEDGKIEVLLRDGEDSYEFWRNLGDFSTSESLYLLRELEGIISYVQETGEKVVKEYNPDYEPDEE